MRKRARYVGIGAIGLAVIAGAVSLFSHNEEPAERKIKPLAWGNFVGDSRKDALVAVPLEGYNLETLGVIDGALIRRDKNNGDFYTRANLQYLDTSPDIILPQGNFEIWYENTPPSAPDIYINGGNETLGYFVNGVRKRRGTIEVLEQKIEIKIENIKEKID